MRNRLLAVLLSVFCLSSCALLQNGTLDSTAVASAAANALTALSISDAQISQLCAQSVAYYDKENTVLTSGSYVTRLQKLTKDIKVDGLNLNFKVYKTNQVNAFACGDGSVRVYSGLMDVMDDDQLMAIIGHEIGHVALKHSKKSTRRAYMSAAARDMVSSVGGAVGVISSSLIGDVAESLVSAQHSQRQEYQADEYGFKFAVKYGHDKYSMYRALNKLLDLSGGSSTSGLLAKSFSSHPATDKRAAKVKAKADALK